MIFLLEKLKKLQKFKRFLKIFFLLKFQIQFFLFRRQKHFFEKIKFSPKSIKEELKIKICF